MANRTQSPQPSQTASAKSQTSAPSHTSPESAQKQKLKQKQRQNQERKPEQKPNSKITKAKILFTIFVLAWALFATLASQYIVAVPMAWILKESIQWPIWSLVYYILTYALTLLLVIVVPPKLVQSYHKHSKSKHPRAAKQLATELQTTPTSIGMQHAPTFVDIGLAPVGYILYCVLATVLTTIMTNFPWFNPDQSQNVGFSYFITDLDRIIAMLAIVFVAPIAEEIVMRGWLYGKVRDKWNIPVSIILTSLLFGILHGQWNVGISTFALSVILCGLREITGTIWSGMLLHILSNGIAFYLLYVAI